MQSNNTPQPYTVLELTPQALFDIYGTYCHAFEQTVLTAMRRLLQDQYTGGAYELRKYLNGAVALVLLRSIRSAHPTACRKKQSPSRAHRSPQT